ncbi:MAG: hypothetical protein FWC46_07620 [Actinomycetia bacterium]|nr:hypothetical protein [Actinomycetes bacterium]
MTAIVLAGLAGLVVLWAWLPGVGRPDRLAPERSSRRMATAAPRVPVVVLVVGLVALALVPRTDWALVGVGVVVVGTAVWVLRRGATERRRLRNRAEVVRACGVIAGQLEIGEIPSRAIQVGAHDCPLLAPAASALAIGGDPADELRRIGQEGGCAGLADLADGWQLSTRTGMPLAAVVRQVADTVRTQADDESTREAELSSARATGRLMVVLPGVGMMLGYFVDANPLAFLFGTWVGQLCLLGAACLACAGLVWTQRLSEEAP